MNLYQAFLYTFFSQQNLNHSSYFEKDDQQMKEIIKRLFDYMLQ